ncbi:hypothetical protein BDZ94DRAFT_1261325 [Collybia nuda]|uniref:Uncharacterized protein n=1 Tax=Collybia nuda TaxID=64659 RepID=A0A9P5Y6X7_9AGAR|nr:hypothetical protein BDZ94DRAFT_1261325 [Collybia nuda]
MGSAGVSIDGFRRPSITYIIASLFISVLVTRLIVSFTVFTYFLIYLFLFLQSFG